MIALSPDPIDSFNITILISLLHTTTSNENKYSQRNATSLHPPPYALSVPAFSPGKTRKSTLSSSRMSTTKLAHCSLHSWLPLWDETFKLSTSSTHFMQPQLPSYLVSIPQKKDALPAAQLPKPEGSSSVPVVNTTVQKSNIVAVSVCPGISRVDTISALFNADWTIHFTPLGIALYVILQPVLRIFFKSPEMAMQSTLHALFLPTPLKVPPGTLYRECAVVTLQVSVPEKLALSNPEASPSKKGKGKAGEEVLEILDDGEYGGEVAGRLVWEAYEEALKVWGKENPASEEDIKREEERKRKQEKVGVVDEVSPH
ncbi:hypothetical protein K443DRAFT_5676 [Laccaria amethystina LaAM-08-1]|uniref:Uncharacterized protein n=1 Tax=Laccaria amethystina LaAM-08-1 TaxID=1095629 RepID=A0A0C9XDZ2_9AGAR|nr:hypothetical protein K443DRAFT_5676 [Laccaria amethystina LaAM-08-1]